MANKYELVEKKVKKYNFSYLVVSIPEDELGDKLIHVSPPEGTGLISRTEYQNFLFTKFILDVNNMFLFMAKATGGDIEEQVKIREELEEGIYEVNPGLNPDNLVFSSGGVIRPNTSGNGTPLTENRAWDKDPDNEEINPFILVQEFEIFDDPANMASSLADLANSEDEEEYKFNDVPSVKKLWDRINVRIAIRKFSKNDLFEIFEPGLSFTEDIQYKIYVTNACLVDAEAVYTLVDAMGAADNNENVANELYSLCVEVNPFLELGLIDLSKISRRKSKSKKLKKTKKKKQAKDARKFSDVSKKELLSLAGRMKKRIVGQDHAVDQIVETVQVASCGLRNPEKPIAVYLLCGQTGVGKTHCAKVLAEDLCGSKENIVRVDCSEFTQPHDIQKLLGAPPSYIGHEDGGFLTNAIQENPFSVVLFDEIEKANSKLFDILLQIMDDARLTDGKGNTADFSESIILLTSNVGVSETNSVVKTIGFGDSHLLDDSKRDKAIQDALKNQFRPEFLNRVDATVSFRNLDEDDSLSIVSLELDVVKKYLADKSIEATFTDNVCKMIYDKGFSDKYGARPLQRTVEREVSKPLALKMLQEELVEGHKIEVDFDEEIQINIIEEPEEEEHKEVASVARMFNA